jgi:hypothetical protein
MPLRPLLDNVWMSLGKVTRDKDRARTRRIQHLERLDVGLDLDVECQEDGRLARRLVARGRDYGRGAEEREHDQKKASVVKHARSCDVAAGRTSAIKMAMMAIVPSASMIVKRRRITAFLSVSGLDATI